MFARQEFIIILSKNVIHLVKTNFSEANYIDFYEKYNWDDKNLVSVIAEIDKKHKIDHAGFLLDDDLSYVFTSKVFLEDKKTVSREDVQKEISEKIPEDIRELKWDYKITKLSDDGWLVQVAAISSSVANILSEIANTEHLIIDFIEPISYATARLTQEELEMHIVVLESKIDSIFLLADKGVVYYVQTYDFDNFQDAFLNFNAYVRNKFSLNDDTKLILSSESKILNADYFKSFGFKNIELKSLNPFASFRDTDLYKGKDLDILNIDLREEEDSAPEIKEEKLQKNNKSEAKSSKTRLIIMIVVLVGLVGSAIFLILNMNR